MTSNETREYRAVRNHLGDYSIWPEGHTLPDGWESVSAPGTKEHVLATVRQMWTSLQGVTAPAPSTPAPTTSAPSTSAPSTRNPWLLRPPTEPKPLRMYCFAHCGGSVGEFLRLRELLPGVEFIGVQLPGRGPRLSEPNVDDIDELVRRLTSDVEFEGPFVFFGHSGGALFAYETARTLAESGRQGPEALIVSAYPAPHFALNGIAVHDLPDEALLSVVYSSYGGVAPETLSDAGMSDLALPAFRADFKMCEQYRYSPRRAELTIPIMALGGIEDSLDRPSLGDWHRHTTADFSVKMFDGGHFYFRDDPKALCDYIAGELAVRTG